jgi:hypothetical protein
MMHSDGLHRDPHPSPRNPPSLMPWKDCHWPPETREGRPTRQRDGPGVDRDGRGLIRHLTRDSCLLADPEFALVSVDRICRMSNRQPPGPPSHLRLAGHTLKERNLSTTFQFLGECDGILNLVERTTPGR